VKRRDPLGAEALAEQREQRAQLRSLLR